MKQGQFKERPVCDLWSIGQQGDNKTIVYAKIEISLHYIWYYKYQTRNEFGQMLAYAIDLFKAVVF